MAIVRRRWWARRVLEAAALALLLAMLVVAAGIAYMAWSRFDEGPVALARIAVYVALPLVFALVLLPLLRRRSVRAAARYLESRDGGLDALLISAAEVSERLRAAGADAGKGSLEERLLQRAVAACDGSPAIRALERARVRRAGLALAGLAVVAAGLLLSGYPPIRHGLALIVLPQADPAVDNPYRFRVAPGNVTVLAGEDQTVTAVPEHFQPQSVELFTRAPEDKAWTRAVMTVSPDGHGYQSLLADLQRSREYYVRSGSVASTAYRIRVVPRPRISRIDLLYHYPRRTGLAPKLVRDGSAIEGVRGTRVEVRAVPDRDVRPGDLVVDGERHVPLRPVDGELRGTIVLQNDGRYRIDLPAGQSLVAIGDEHSIRVHEDALPTVKLLWPGRDTRVTSVEEMDVTVQARDDFAVRDLALHLNVNGEERDRIVRFAADPAHPGKVQGTYTVSLEELGLSPGDLITYHARASDALDEPERVVTTDLYFMQVRPFEQRFHRAAGGGAGGAGGGGQGQGDTQLAAQQRSVVVALFKLLRDRETLDEEVVRDRLETLRTAQGRIRDRVDAIVRRLGPRGFVSGNDGYQRIAEELPRASRAMVETEAQLAVADARTALPPAREALLHLQRADAALRDVQVAMAQAGGGGNPGSQDDVSNLFRLEMDKFRNQYDSLQHGQWDSGNRDLEDALARLRELARRQQREIERAPLRGHAGAAGANSQQALAAEVEKLRRELERLTRQRDQARAAQAKRALNQLEAAGRAMNRAGKSGDARAAREALERLHAVQRDLERNGTGALARGVQDAIDRTDAAIVEQSDIQKQLKSGSSRGAPDASGAAKLAERKRELADNLRELRSDVDRLAREADRAQSKAAPDLDAAGRVLRERRLEARARQAAKTLEHDPGALPAAGEAAVARDLDTVRQRLAGAAESIRAGEARQDSRRTLERLRALVRGLKADQQRLDDAANARAARSGTGRAAGATGRAAGDASGGIATGGAAGWTGGYDPGYRIDLPMLRGQMADRLSQIEALRDELRGVGNVARDIRALIGAMNELDPAASAEELQALRARQAALLARLQTAELRLREKSASPPSLSARESAPIAPRFEDAVDRYYRNLSEPRSPRQP